MTQSADTESSGPFRLTGYWLTIARLAWLFIFVLTLSKTTVGLPRFYVEKAQVCSDAISICNQTQSLNLEQAGALEKAGISIPVFAGAVISWRIIISIIWMGIGVLIFLLRSDDWMALIASALMVLYTTGQYTDPIINAYPGLTLPSQLIFNLQNILLFLFIGLFPGGYFIPRWMRWYWLVMCVVSLIPVVFLPGLSNSNLIALFWLSFLILGPYSQIYRYFRSSSLLERQQTKWVVFGFATMAALILLQFAFTLLTPGQNGLLRVIIQDFYFDLAGLLLPLSIGFSVLRYRLWDIDVIIRRTLVYALMTAALALVFFGSVTLLQSLFQAVTGAQSPVSIVLSTLAIAALFNPLRIYTQNFIDRRFFRRKYDAQKTLARFVERARDETDIEQLSADLIEVLQETMQPENVSLWLKKTQRGHT